MINYNLLPKKERRLGNDRRKKKNVNNMGIKFEDRTMMMGVYEILNNNSVNSTF